MNQIKYFLIFIVLTISIGLSYNNKFNPDYFIPLSRKQIISLEEGSPVYSIHGIQTTFNGKKVIIKKTKNGLLINSKVPIYRDFRNILLTNSLIEKNIVLNNRNSIKFENIKIAFNNYDEKTFLVSPVFSEENIELMRERYTEPNINIDSNYISNSSISNLLFEDSKGNILKVNNFYNLKDALTGEYFKFPDLQSLITKYDGVIPSQEINNTTIDSVIDKLAIDNTNYNNEFNNSNVNISDQKIILKNKSTLIFKNSNVLLNNIEIISKGTNSIIFYDCPKIVLENVKIIGIDNYKNNLIDLPSGLTFSNSNVIINNSSFISNTSGDDFINFYDSNFEVNNSVFKDILYDAIDSDFSRGLIQNSKFINIGNDAIDVSGSKVRGYNNFFVNVLDKGLSIGEISFFESEKNIFKNSSIGIVVKDGSELNSIGDEFDNNILDVSSFMKKDFYQYPKLNIKNLYSLKYLIEPNILIDSNPGIVRTKNVESLMYGNFFGRKSER